MVDIPLPRKRPVITSDEMKAAAQGAAPKQAVGDPTKACVLGDIIAYDIEGHYIGTKPPFGNEAYLSTKETVDAHRVGEKVDREAIIATLVETHIEDSAKLGQRAETNVTQMDFPVHQMR